MIFVICQEPADGRYFWRLEDEEKAMVARCPILLESRQKVEEAIEKLQLGAAGALAKFRATGVQAE